MNEWKRIARNKKFVVFVVVIVMLNSILFVKEQQDKLQEQGIKESVWTFAEEYKRQIKAYQGKPFGEVIKQIEKVQNTSKTEGNGMSYALDQLNKQVSYLISYPEFLKTIEENMGKYQKISIFADQGGFSYKNSKKTVKDFEDMDGESLSLGNHLGIKYFFEFTMTDYLVVLLLVGLCMQLVTEKKNGLWSVIHSTVNGRANLAAKRVGILVIASILATVFLYGANIVLALQLYGGGKELSAEIQCIEQYMKVDEICSIVTFLIKYLSIKALGMLAVTLLIYFVLTAVSDMIAGILVIGIVTAVQYILYTTIPMQSSLLLFKYINAFSLIEYEKVSALYLNVNLFGHPVDIHLLLLVVVVIEIIVMIPLIIIIGARKYPNGRSSMAGRLIYKITELFGVIVSKMHFFGFEVFKHGVFEGGIIITIVMLLVAHDGLRANSYKSYDKVNTYINHFYAENEGADSNKAMSYITEQEEKLKQSERELGAIEADYETGKITYSEYINQSASYEFIKDKREAIDLFNKQVIKLKEYETETGVSGSMINPNGYTILFGAESYEMHRIFACKTLLFLVLYIHLLFVYEKQTKACFLVRVTVKGRSGFFRRKLMQIIVLSGILVAVFFGVDIYNVNMVYGMQGMASAAGSIECLRYIKSDISILQFMGIIFMARWMVLTAAGCLIMFLSVKAKKREQALWGAMVLLVVPALLILLGVKQARKISFVLPLSVIELVEHKEVLRSDVIFAYSFVMAAAILCAGLTRKIWCKEMIV